MVEKIYWAEMKVKLFAPKGKEKSTLIAIAHYANPDGHGSFVSQERLSWDTGHDRRTVRRHIKALVMSGQLETRVDIKRDVPSDRFYIPLVARTLQDLMTERQLAGLPLFHQGGRDKMSLGEGQTVPGAGTERPSTNQLPTHITKKEEVVKLKTKKDRSIEVAQQLDKLAEDNFEMSPETQQVWQELLKELEAGVSMGNALIVEPERLLVPFLPPLTEQTWQKTEEGP